MNWMVVLERALGSRIAVLYEISLDAIRFETHFESS